jgi:hypothetical protein
MHPAIVRLSQGFGCKVRLQMRGGSGGCARIRRRPPRLGCSGLTTSKNVSYWLDQMMLLIFALSTILDSVFTASPGRDSNTSR